MLTTEELEVFERDGIVKIPSAFSADDAAGMRDVLWRELSERHGMDRDDRSTWTTLRPTGLKTTKFDRRAHAILGPRVRSALDGLLGEWIEPKHEGQVLAGQREEWLTVDPVLFRGDIEYDLGRVLWWNLDKMDDIVRYFDLAVQEADLDRDRARDWVLWRTVDYWLYGLSVGLTEDPVRCARLISALCR